MKIAHRFAPPVGALALFSLAACGGGGAGGASVAPISDLARARALTGSQAPAGTPADQAARAPGIVERADSLIVSTIAGETTHRDLPTFQVRTNCAGTRCSWRNSTTGVSGSLGLNDLEFSSGSSRAVLTKNGITLLEGRAEGVEAYGAWMDHAVFAVQSERTRTEGIVIDGRYGIAGGDLTGVRPDVTATWRGLMVGTPRDGALRGNVLQGDAALTYTLSGAGGALDAAFTDIKDLDRNAAHATPAMRFDDVPVAADGTYRAGLTGNRIQGGFYGPNHAEAAGVVEQGGIVGAFGAKRR